MKQMFDEISRMTHLFAKLRESGGIDCDPGDYERMVEESISALAYVKAEHEYLSEIDQQPKKWKDGKCFTCEAMTSFVAGNPGLWPLWLPFKNGNGRFRCYHMNCVTKTIAAAEEAKNASV